MLQTLGAGGGRPSSITMANTSNAVLYGVFVLSGFMASTFLNHFGPRITLIIAISGYPFFTGRAHIIHTMDRVGSHSEYANVVVLGSMWYFDSHGHIWFPTVAGAYLGFSAGLLWTTAAFFSNGYSEEKDRGLWRAIQWTSNVGGATIGGCISLG